jgi:hypothetical protein
VAKAADRGLIATIDDDHLQLQAVQDVYNTDPTFNVLVNSLANSLSPAENALREASGLDFGCGQPDHNFQNCPSRDNPEERKQDLHRPSYYYQVARIRLCI